VLKQECTMASGIDLPSFHRALTVVTSEPRYTPRYRPLPGAPFLAQLIANAGGFPQTRERRRAEPAEVVAAYRAAMARVALSKPQ
jgi:hypothetical protein